MEYKKGKENYECVQCRSEMEYSYGNLIEGVEMFSAPFCNDPSCPNYGLLQTGFIPIELSLRKLQRFNCSFLLNLKGFYETLCCKDKVMIGDQGIYCRKCGEKMETFIDDEKKFNNPNQ